MMSTSATRSRHKSKSSLFNCLCTSRPLLPFLTAMLLREGMPANHKRVYRLYRRKGWP